jgi:hypothetical protein
LSELRKIDAPIEAVLMASDIAEKLSESCEIFSIKFSMTAGSSTSWSRFTLGIKYIGRF